MDTTEARARLSSARSARLATVSGEGVPHLVPITFAVEGARLYFAVDHKPKRSTNLRRLRNIAENPRVAVLADHYADDWTQLWWVRADGNAEIWEDGPGREHALDLLAARYEQYREQRPAGPVVVVTVTNVSGWSFSG